ncbi:NAD(P)/FAD-dependent oxidoreductase [Mucilaginibacter sp. CSA2-8R]|uniref:NAD(P)/FAD-dependent oxidoreductase n=1 Tax=Mucilaginibacter sp. CSA2-8R TaxID=3141542 RepID=UPI00315D274E
MKVVIVGGGFAGMNLAKGLAGKKDVDVLLVDKHNYHLFAPLLYQVATSFIEASNISYPFRKMLQGKKNVRFYHGALKEVKADQNLIVTEYGTINYDVLVLALGTVTNYFGMENLEKHSMPMKTIDDALRIRNHMLVNMEKVTREADEKEREKLMNIVITGGGPTGVELAGMIAEMGKHIVKKDYPELSNVRGNVYLVSSGDELLGSMSETASTEALRRLTKLGVHVKSGVAVKDCVDGKVVLANGEELPTQTLIWAAGVTACRVPGLPEESLARGKRIKVDEFNKVSGTQNIYAIGDISLMNADEEYPDGHPQLAQVAIQQGTLLAKNLVCITKKEEIKPFVYNNKGSMAIISKYRAVVDLPKFSFTGYFAWVTWLIIHIFPLAGFTNKLKTVFNWMMSFFTNDPSLRLILRYKAESR